MKLTTKLALSQIKGNRGRTIWTLLGIVLCVAMVTAVCGFAAGALETFRQLESRNVDDIMYPLAGILGGIIAVASVVVISNAFRVSAGERTQQFGILKSVGATKRQILSIILREGLLFCAVGIPAGILVGIFVQFAGTSIANWMLGFINTYVQPPISLVFTISPWALAASAAGCFATVMFSAFLPARKAARVPAIDAIRRSGDVKVNRKKMRTSRLVGMLFGFEGTLAAKSLKRSRRSFRATVLSLSISIVLLLAAAAFQSSMLRLSTLAITSKNATAVVTFSGDLDARLPYEAAERFTQRLRERAPIFAVGGEGGFVTRVDGQEVTAQIMAVDALHYAELCSDAGLPEGSNILLNLWYTKEGEKIVESRPYAHLQGQELTLTPIDEGRSEETLRVDGVLTDVPTEIMEFMDLQTLCVIVPERAMLAVIWNALAEDSDGFLLYVEEIARETLTDAYYEGNTIGYANINQQQQTTMQLGNLIMVFVYGFVGMLSLISLTNVISTISTNTRLRAQEFAILTSVGMDRKGLGQMLTLESILCSLRALFFGLPLGILASWGVHMGITNGSYVFPYQVPWLALAECAVGVFIVTFIATRFCASRLRQGNLVETIRAGSGV